MMCSRNDDVIDDDPSNFCDRRSFRSALTLAEPDKDRRCCDVAHREIRNGDVFDVAAIDRLDRKPAAVYKVDVRDRDVLKPAIRFCSQLYPAGHSIFVRSELLGGLKSSVEHRSEIES